MRGAAPVVHQRLEAFSALCEQFLGAVALGDGQQRVDLGGREAELEQPVAGEPARIVAAGDHDRGSEPSAGATFSRSSTMMRSAVRLPMPGTAWKRAASPAASAPASSRGVPPLRIAERDLRADALDAEQQQEEVALLLGGEAVELHRVVADDEVRVQRRRGARPRGPGAASRPTPRGGSRRRRPSPARRGRRGGPRPRRRRGRSPDARQVGRAGGRARPSFAWQMATASASAAWSGVGGDGSASSAWTMRLTCSLSARPLPQTAPLTCCGV